VLRGRTIQWTCAWGLRRAVRGRATTTCTHCHACSCEIGGRQQLRRCSSLTAMRRVPRFANMCTHPTSFPTLLFLFLFFFLFLSFPFREKSFFPRKSCIDPSSCKDGDRILVTCRSMCTDFSLFVLPTLWMERKRR